MSIHKAAALLLLSTFAFGAFANDLILKFKVLDCNGIGAKDVVITLEGCVDPVLDNSGQPFTAVTDVNGDAAFAPNADHSTRAFIEYCNGASNGYCKWTAQGPTGKTYDSVIKTLQSKTATGTMDVTAREASGCKCTGWPEVCNSPIYYDAEQPGVTWTSTNVKPIILREQNCPCPPPVIPPPAKCPSHCKFEVKVTKGHPNKKEYNETVKGMCSGGLKLTEKCGEKPEHVCPRGYINSQQPCTGGKDCGVCCVAQTSLCAVKRGGKCNKFGGQCMCREVKGDATCKTLPYPTILKAMPKENRNPKVDDDDDSDDKVNWSGKTDSKDTRKLQESGSLQLSSSYTNDWSSQIVDGCQDHLCGAVAAKGGFTASCCAHYP